MSELASTSLKTKTPKRKKTYGKMIEIAIGALEENNGSSRQAILKYIATNFNVEPTTAHIYVKRALRRGVEKGDFVPKKASFKLAKKRVAKKKTKKKSQVKKTTLAKKNLNTILPWITDIISAVKRIVN